jgi:small-conductance mechanosensitive channel
VNLLRRLTKGHRVFLNAARREGISPKSRVTFAMLADANEEAIDTIKDQSERITLLENAMRTADQAVQALVADDKALRQQVADLTAQNAAKDQQIAALQANSITDATLADVNTLVPEPPAPTEGQPA